MTEPLQLISARHQGIRTTLRECLRYIDLLCFLVWRSIKVRYAQSILGFGWAIVQPLAQMVVFSVVFGSLVGVESDGQNYALFSFVALVPWTYFSNALTQATSSLSANSQMISKIYFPRLILPVSIVCARLVDFAIGLALLTAILLFLGAKPTVAVIVLPLLIVIMMLTATGAAFWLSALSIQYRDINYAAGFGVQLMMYGSPVVYSVSLVPEKYQLLFAINPLVGVIDGFRAALLGSSPVRWDLIGIGAIVSILLFVTGLIYFQRRQHVFADVV